MYSYDDWPSFLFSNHCLKKENLQAHFTFVPSPWQNAQPQYDAFKPFPPQTQGFHHIIILYSRGGEARLWDMIPFRQRCTEIELFRAPNVLHSICTHVSSHTQEKSFVVMYFIVVLLKRTLPQGKHDEYTMSSDCQAA